MSKRETTTGVPARLRSARHNMDMSQPELSCAVGYSKQLISAWECGKAQMSAAQAADCARVLKLDLNWLLLGVASTSGALGGWRSAVPIVDAADVFEDTISSKLAAPNEGPTFRLPDYSFAFAHTDASMAPLYHEGDIALIDPIKPPSQGDIVLVESVGTADDSGMVVLRRISFLVEPGKLPLLLAPVSADWPVLRINEASEARILGCAVAVVRRFADAG